MNSRVAYITVDGRRYMIRGAWTSAQLNRQYANYLQRNLTLGRTSMGFATWLKYAGKVHVSQKKS